MALTVHVTPEPMQVIYVGDSIDAYVEWSPSPPTVSGYNVLVRWGDGVDMILPQYAASPATSLTHAYAAEGTYVLEAWVVNSDTGESGRGSIPVYVKPLPTGIVQLQIWPAQPSSVVTEGYTDPAGITPTGVYPASYNYAAGTIVSIKAFALSGYTFDYWIIDWLTTDTSNPLSLLMDRDRVLKPVFRATGQPPIWHTLIIDGAVGGSTDPVDGTYTYIENMTLTVTAIPATTPTPGYKFNGWYLDGVFAGYNATITVVFDADHRLTPVFAPISSAQYTLTIDFAVGGHTSPASGAYLSVAGSTVTVSAIADQGCTFIKWLLDGAEVSTPYPGIIDVVMDRDHELTPVFSAPPPPPTYSAFSVDATPINVDFTLNTIPEVTPYSASIQNGVVLDITLPKTVVVGPDTYYFSKWEDASTNPSRTITLTANTALTATYSTVPPTQFPGWLDWRIVAGVTAAAVIAVVAYARHKRR